MWTGPLWRSIVAQRRGKSAVKWWVRRTATAPGNPGHRADGPDNIIINDNDNNGIVRLCDASPPAVASVTTRPNTVTSAPANAATVVASKWILVSPWRRRYKKDTKARGYININQDSGTMDHDTLKATDRDNLLVDLAANSDEAPSAARDDYSISKANAAALPSHNKNNTNTNWTSAADTAAAAKSDAVLGNANN